MLTEVCAELRNWFCREKYFGTITIEDNVVYITNKRGIFVTGDIPVRDYIQEGQYFRIIGSLFNDGVYEMPSSELTDETFEGAIWAMAVPPAVIALSDEIDAWRQKYEAADSGALSPYMSESFGGYSYSKGSGSSTAGGRTAATWQSVFAARLDHWRKV